MGFKRSALLLEWPEDSEFAGLEVRMRRLSLRQLLRIERLSDLRKSSSTEETEAAMVEMLDIIGKGLLSWNYEDDDGTPVPATRESLDDLDLGLIRALVGAWTKAAAGVPLASPPSSPTGGPGEPPDELGQWLAWEQQRSQESSPAPA